MMNEFDAEFGDTIFSSVDSETFTLNGDFVNSTDEELSDLSHTDMIELSYGDKGIVVNELRMDDFSWLMD